MRLKIKIRRPKPQPQTDAVLAEREACQRLALEMADRAQQNAAIYEAERRPEVARKFKERAMLYRVMALRIAARGRKDAR